jgi:hypothetical protein
MPPQIRRLEQAVHWLGEQTNLALGREQRGFDVPPKSDLFE